MITAMKIYTDDIKIICYNQDKEDRDFEIEFNNFSNMKGLCSLYVQHRGKLVLQAKRMYNSSYEYGDTLTLKCSNHCSSNSRDKKDYCKFLNYLVKAANKIGVTVIFTDELSSNEKAWLSFQKQAEKQGQKKNLDGPAYARPGAAG